MKKLKATITNEDGTTKTVLVLVDNQTAEMLEKLEDEKMVNEYLLGEYELKMADYRERLNMQSLDASLDGGFDIEDPEQDLFENYIQKIDNEKLREAIKRLEPQQQWLVYQIYFEGRTQKEIAKELGIDKTSLTKRKERILKKLKKFLG